MEQFLILFAKFDCPVARQNFHSKSSELYIEKVIISLVLATKPNVLNNYKHKKTKHFFSHLFDNHYKHNHKICLRQWEARLQSKLKTMDVR